MSLPPGFLDELKTRLTLSQVVGRKVTWDSRKSNAARGDFWAACPFHQEKSASFHVLDAKGFYYCFGCHAKGDALSFVQETENLGFMEAVERLAGEAGMAMPARDPQAEAKADRASLLARVMEKAVQHYRLMLKTAAATEAREYLLQRRGLDAAALDRWEIGFAPDVRRGIYTHLTGQGVPADLLVGAGLCGEDKDGGTPYDRFRGRIIFPIRDARGRAIALGGRAMEPNARAKYLNSEKTELFDKGRSLYNIGPAREAAGKGAPVIVAEGYMDVIALSEAGFGATVAPLGTAITPEQLQMVWRLSPEPVIALDGDQAGLGAARRLIDLALPLLGGGRTLRFAVLPPGLDPDDLIRAQGAEAMQAAVDAAIPLVEMLWQRAIEGQDFETPERRAGLETSLRAVIAKIPDAGLRAYYDRDLRNRTWRLFRPPRQGKGWRPGKVATAVLPSTRTSLLAAAGDTVEGRLQEALILAVILAHPELLADALPHLEDLEFQAPEHREIASVLLDAGDVAPEALAAHAAKALGAPRLEKLASLDHVRLARGARPGDSLDDARQCLAETLGVLTARRAMRGEIREAEEDILGGADEGLSYRLANAGAQLERAFRPDPGESAEFDEAPNGARISRQDRESAQRAFDNIDFSRGGRRG